MSQQQKPFVIAVVGSTATGKTALSVALAHWFNAEIISADSQLVYQDLNIGTAKPTLAEREGIPHHMIDLVAPSVSFSAAAYQEKASRILKNALEVPKKTQKNIIVAGGTGFYLKALLESQFIPSVPPNPEFRAQMQAWAEVEGSSSLHAHLARLDPVRAAALHSNDRVRIIRALEIIEATGKPVPNQNEERPFHVCWLGLTYEDRDLLRTRIDERIDLMLAQGWLAEVEEVIARYGPQAHALGVAHGYPELRRVVQGEWTLAEAIPQIQLNIHQYARRQMTWFRRNKHIHWLTCDQFSFEARLKQAKALITEEMKR